MNATLNYTLKRLMLENRLPWTKLLPLAFLKEYILALFSVLTSSRKKGLLHQTTPLEATVHKTQPGDWVLIKRWRHTPLQPSWEGPYLVLLTTGNFHMNNQRRVDPPHMDKVGASSSRGEF